MEVGSGKGLFLSTASAARPDLNFLGVEISGGYARLCGGKLAAQRAANARIVHGDATYLARSLLPDACLAAIHVYFPDPWWKARHRKRRVLSDAFLIHAGRVLIPGGQLHIWTDVEEYFHEAMAAAQGTGLFSAARNVEVRPAEHDLDYRTHFERRTRLAGAPVWRALLERSAAPATCVRTAVPLPG
jgi:tRNA (guanine-N7-)-methyltransferase